MGHNVFTLPKNMLSPSFIELGSCSSSFVFSVFFRLRTSNFCHCSFLCVIYLNYIIFLSDQYCLAFSLNERFKIAKHCILVIRQTQWRSIGTHGCCLLILFNSVASVFPQKNIFTEGNMYLEMEISSFLFYNYIRKRNRLFRTWVAKPHYHARLFYRGLLKMVIRISVSEWMYIRVRNRIFKTSIAISNEIRINT